MVDDVLHLGSHISPNELLFPVFIVGHGNMRDNLLAAGRSERWSSIPAFARSVDRRGNVSIGMIPRECTGDYLGRQYRLKVVPHVQESVKLIRGFIVVQAHRPAKPEVTRELVEAWYRDRAHIKFPERIELCLGLFPDPEAFRPMGLIVRQTRQRWGSMSPAGRLLLNRRLGQGSRHLILRAFVHHASTPRNNLGLNRQIRKNAVNFVNPHHENLMTLGMV